MRIAGIVAEYNPFHNGHAYHIEQTRAETGGQATHVVAVMSGTFTQRGEPALLPKADRVRAALRGGVDLVLELPVPWALSSAESFARGAVQILSALQCVDVLSFGSECGDLPLLQKAAALTEHPRFADLLRYRMGGGIPYPEARQMVMRELGGDRVADLLSQPNNTLGIEYLRALSSGTSRMEAFTVRRFGVDHDAVRPLGDIASAGYLRSLLREGRLMNALPFVPAASGQVLSEAMQEGRCPAAEERLERAMLSQLRRLSVEDFAALPAMSEGLENRLYAASREAVSLEALWQAVKTKRYPLTRLRRALYSAFLGICADDAASAPPYIRPLGANARGIEILSAAKAAGCALPILSRAAVADTLTGAARRIWELECAATDQYALALPTPYAAGADYTVGMQKEE